MANQDIKQSAKKANVPLWKVGEHAYGISDSQFSRKLRHELPEDDKQRILMIIRNLSNTQ